MIAGPQHIASGKIPILFQALESGRLKPEAALEVPHEFFRSRRATGCPSFAGDDTALERQSHAAATHAFIPKSPPH
jgi:hypothetical protein